jgi:hypothetical protein
MSGWMAGYGNATKPHFYRVELNKTEWQVHERYQNLTPIGSGAYGQVWYVASLHKSVYWKSSMYSLTDFSIYNLMALMCHFNSWWQFAD